MSQIRAVHFKNHKYKNFNCLKIIDYFNNFVLYFTLVIKNLGLYTNIAKEKIKYGKLL